MDLFILAPDELDDYLDRHACVLVDLRTRHEYLKMHIQGAVHVPYAQLDQYLLSFVKQIPVVFYCARGGASLAACKRLGEMGYQALSVMGGFAAYRGRYLEKLQ